METEFQNFQNFRIERIVGVAELYVIDSSGKSLRLRVSARVIAFSKISSISGVQWLQLLAKPVAQERANRGGFFICPPLSVAPIPFFLCLASKI
jgi:hypothetical protein